MIATDGSPDASTAVKEGVSLAQEVCAAVTFVCVRTPALVSGPVYERASDEETAHARRAVDKAMRIAIDANVDADYEIVDGSPVEAILDVARNLDAWFVVVGSRGRGAVQGALFGSVSHGLVTHADRPVLVAREREPATVA